MDNYAGVTWSNAPDGRYVLIGWMNNWLYADRVPASPWCSAMTLPRELSLIEYSTITLSNAEGAKYVVVVNAANRQITTQRNSATGKTDFSDMFSVPSATAPLNTEGNEATLHFFIDQSSVELFTANGSMSQTNLVFPGSIYNKVDVDGGVVETSVRTIRSIYK